MNGDGRDAIDGGSRPPVSASKSRRLVRIAATAGTALAASVAVVTAGTVLPVAGPRAATSLELGLGTSTHALQLALEEAVAAGKPGFGLKPRQSLPDSSTPEHRSLTDVFARSKEIAAEGAR